jgi:hypothetical protein
MSEAKFESITRELRATAPAAPEKLRDLVRTLPTAQPRLALRLRPALSAAVAIAIAVGLGAALIGGLRGSQTGNVANFSVERSAQTRAPKPVPGLLPANPYEPRAGKLQSSVHGKAFSDTGGSSLKSFAPTLTPGSRLQRYDVSMGLRVRDLSRSTQAAVRQTRKLGGYVSAANYSTGADTGDSRLDLRVPVQHVQQAIAGFTELGTILSQRISVGDLQAPLDQTDARIAAARKVIAELEAKSFRTPAEQMRLDAAKGTLKRLTAGRSRLVREGTYAKISLQLTTRKPAAKHVAPGRFERFWGDAGDILGKEAIAVLYTLVVAGPFALLAALALVGERARRRRADHRLLEETG